MDVESCVVCIVGKMARDAGMVSKFCGVILILFGRFLRVFEGVCLFCSENFFVTYFCCTSFFFF